MSYRKQKKAISKFDTYQALVTQIWVAHGNVTDASGNPIYCNPILTPKRVIEWNCTDSSLSENNTFGS